LIVETGGQMIYFKWCKNFCKGGDSTLLLINFNEQIKIIMAGSVKDKIYKMLDTINDEKVLAQVMEDVAFYSSRKDAVDYLNENQLKELDEAI
jgi:hypothetical protein